MFTGIVDHCGTLLEVEGNANTSLHIHVASKFDQLIEGESIAVDGVCLTVVSPTVDGHFRCDISPETLSLTLAGSYKKGTSVNLERALRVSDRLGGYILTGHVEQRAEVSRRKTEKDFVELEISGVLKDHEPYLIKKGNVVVNGVSLTINEVIPQGFRVCLIPHTLERTNLNELGKASPVNLEFDYTTKVIVNQVNRLVHETMRPTCQT
jgi:riboflavin synthase